MQNAAETYDLVVIGGGPGGYVAAIRSAQLGLKTALVERDHLGGICLNWGCIPTKALLRSAEVLELMQRADEFGLTADNISFDLDKIVDRSRKVSARLTGGIGHLMKKNKITVIEGTAKLTAKNQVAVALNDGGAKSLTADRIVLATGARARELPHLKADGKLIWTYKHALQPDCVPGKLLVIGSGAIGIEFASFFNTLGSDVTVVEVLPNILPQEDEEVSKFAAKAFKKQGFTLHTETEVTSLTKKGGAVVAKLKDKKGKEVEQTFDRVILSVGIVANSEGLGLEDVGVKLERGHVSVNEFGQTNVKGIAAIGDLAGPPWLAHKASHEGTIAVEMLAGSKHAHPLDTGNIPGCTYCHPQVASVGLTEAKAREAGYKVKVGRFPFEGNGKAIALGEDKGFIKTVFDEKTGALLGAHMIGAEVTEMIQGFALARTLETTEEELMATVFPHPTLSEMMHESVLDAFGRTLHF